MEPAIFFAGPPNLRELCCLSVSVPMSSNLCVMQPHIVRCREIIFTEPDVLASPTLDMDSTFHIVFQQSLYKSGRLQMRLQKYGMQISKPYSVHPNLYQSCLTYTIIARLSPQWNKAADWMIQGRDFVNHDGYTNAIKMNLSVNKEEIYIALSGTAVRFPPLQVEDLNLSRGEMLALLKSTEGAPKPVELVDAWCHVLPSMKRGRIASLALAIPKESPFVSYKELKRHWKNMYGYRLPDTDEDILYCQIGFLPSGGGKHYTYPSVCLRGGPLHAMPRVDPKPVLTAFLQDLHSRMASVCGMALVFQPKLRYATPALHTSSMPPARSNLSTKQINKPNRPMRDETSMASLFMMGTTRKASLSERLHGVDMSQPGSNADTDPVRSSTSSVYAGLIRDSDQSEQNQTSERTIVESSVHSRNKSLLQTESDAHKFKHTRNQVVKQTNIENIERNALQRQDSSSLPHNASKSQTQTSSGNQITASSKKLVPSFWPKMKPNKGQASSTILNKSHQDLSHSSGVTFVPMFKTHKTQKHSSNPQSSVDSLQRTSSTNQSDAAHRIPTGTTGNALSKPKSYISTDTFNCGTDQNVKLSSCNADDDDDDLFYNLNDMGCAAKTPVNIKGTLFAKTSSQQNQNTNSVIFQDKPHQVKMQMASPAPKGQKNQNFLYSQNDTLRGSLNTSKKDLKTSNTAFGKSTPRPTLADTPVKKPTPRPQVQSVDVEALARANQLSKVNTITLIAWLKERKVACKSKDRKTDLVEKVNAFLNLPQT